MAIDLDRFINFINVELPKRIVLLHGAKYAGDPNLSSDPKVNYSPPGTFYMNYTDKELWQKKDSGKNTWKRTGRSSEDLKELISDTVVAGDNIIVDFNSDTGKLTITGKPLTSEQVQDIIGPTLIGGENITVSYNDDTDRIIIENDRTDEDIASIMNNTLTSGDYIEILLDTTNNVIEVKNTMTSDDISELLYSNFISGDHISLDFDDVEKTISIDTSLDGKYITYLLNSKLIEGDNVTITHDSETGEIKIDSPVIPEDDVKTIIKSYLSGGQNISVSEDDATGNLKIDNDQDVLEILKEELSNYVTSGENISITEDSSTGVLTIKTKETLKDNLFEYLKAGNNITLDQDPSTSEITINSTVSGTGGIITKDVVFSLGGELILGSQEQSEMVLPYIASVTSLTVNIGMSSTNESNLVFSLDRYNVDQGAWEQLEIFGLQVEKNNETYDLDSNIDNDRVRITLISGDFENVNNMTIVLKLQSGEAVEGDKDIVFMLGHSLSLGVQEKTEMYIPYDKLLDSIIVNKGIESSNIEDLVFEIEYYNTSIDDWSILDLITLPYNQFNLEKILDINISYPTCRIKLVSGDYENVTNMSIILRLKNQSNTA